MDLKDPITWLPVYYIYQNPLLANHTTRLADWNFSSWPDYAGLRNGTLCNKEKLFELTGLSEQDCRLVMSDLHEEIIAQLF